MDHLKKKPEFKNNIVFIGLLTIIVSISYGIGLSRLSFYGDDWIYIYNYHIAGSESFTLFTQSDRPYSAWIYILTSSLFGESPIYYHIYLLVFRWLSAFLFWRILSDSFENKRFPLTAALLFATYPGFQQQPISVEFIMHFTSLVLVELSIRLMQKAFFRSGGRLFCLLVLSIAAAGSGIFTCEYFLGLELARPLFLLFTIKKYNKNNNSWKKAIPFLTPYFLMVCFYFIWRIFIFSFTTYEPKLINALKNNPFTGIKLLLSKIVQDLVTVLFRAYRLIFSRPADISTVAGISIFAIIFCIIFALYYHSFRNDKTKAEDKEHFGMLFLGFALLFLSGIPYWGTFLDVSTDFPWDRSTLSFSPGAAIVIAVLLEMAFTPLFFYAAAASITALSVLFHIQNTQIYIHEAEKMNDYFWQLAWRAPELEPGTILASENIPLDRTSDSDLSPIVNWQYAPEKRGLWYDYKYFDLDLREGFYYTDPTTPVPVDHTYRSHMFRSSTDKTLGLFYKKGGCLQIIDNSNTDYPGLPESLVHTAMLSNPGLIDIQSESPAVPPLPIGKEPEHGYCYYFQKTSLSQQFGKTDEAYDYALEIMQNDLHPLYAPDLAPVIRAFLESGDIGNAETMAANNQIGSEDWGYLCTYWLNSVPADPNNFDLMDFYKSHSCL